MEITGKVQSLIKLHKAGFKVPAFFVCSETWSKEQILSKIEEVLPNVQYFAVRSSAESEDSKEKSFAGHFYTALGVKQQDVFDQVLKVQKSYADMSGSVIVQEFVDSDSGGVMFTKVGDSTIVINAIAGLCEPVVSGQACDEYVCGRDGTILRKSISAKKSGIIFVEGKMVTRKIPEESLKESEMHQLIKIGARVQRLFGSPQDIEWCFKDGELYILQSRPITKDFKIAREEYFDSANIAESYSGVVLPLTCSFAKMVYEQVYKDLLRMSGVSRNKIQHHSEIFENLLGFFYGRMYYNMNNWYRMAEFVPGYNRNKKNFELMITSNIKQDIATRIKPSIALRLFYPFLVGIKVAVFGFTSARFKTHVKRQLRLLRNQDFDHLDYKASIALFLDINTNLLRKWYITLENDFFVMTYLGILKKLLTNESMQQAITFPSKATEQVNALVSLSKQISGIEKLRKAVETDNVEQFNIELKNNPLILASLDLYLHTFGGRFASELKLESIGIDEDTKKLFAVLRAYKNYAPRTSVARVNIDHSFSTGFFTKIIVEKFRKYASRREEFRLLRSNTFGIARKLFRHMGLLLKDAGAIEHSDDIFYLRLDEILDSSASMRVDLKDIVARRQKEYESYEKLTLPSHFVTSDQQAPVTTFATNSKEQVLNGRPASSGIVRGRVRVFKEFSMPNHVDFDILVTSHTDPGWTSLIALSKGLIIEHGGVLSHASIVARELGIPAVIGAENATDILKDNQMVEVNGSTGMIRII